ncbi:acetylserotonin O-methyltransferase-like [Magnolia sinica]|uniref:acetylserotonin O-methyltransferase-like n=1 Tax=Magnolia sinica TaxID=86752 RepID=UPI00265A235C|nr:acetylserotonin O-methyltransferase-like [Magnolia sinica]
MAVLKCVIELGIPDVMEAAGQPMTLAEIAAATTCIPSILFRIMRYLVQRRVFGEQCTDEGPTRYDLTPISRRLVTHAEGSMAAFVLFESSPVMLASWDALSAYARGGSSPPFIAAHGEDVWEYAAKHPPYSKLLEDAMACDARNVAPAILDGCVGMFDGLVTVVDVGGGNGTLLGMLVQACPWIKGINFDLPRVVEGAPECKGIQHVGGDMFTAIPQADAVLLKFVLHDWGDEECVQILRKCKEAIPTDKGKIIIIDTVINEEDRERGFNDVKLMLDMAMMAHTNNGKERTQGEWKAIFDEAGFSRYTVKPIHAVQSIIEVYP